MTADKDPYEVIAQNTHLGDLFIVGIQGDPILYKGIPVLPGDFVAGEESAFSMQVVEPTECRGVKKWSIDKIEVLQRVESS